MTTTSPDLNIRLAIPSDRPRLIPLINAAFAIETFLEGTRTSEFQQLTAAALRIGFLTRETEMNLAQLVYDMHGDTDV